MTDKQQVKEYIHYDLNQEIRAIGGGYVLTKEVRLPFGDKDLFYVTGYGVIDSSCCGTGGCGYALVPGFVEQWKVRENTDGLSVSQIEAIRDKEVQEKVRSLIMEKELVQQVIFPV
ncbi:MAG: hypothetical protein V2J25_15565 [Desulfatiglans sp.]|jgi:hypothetical protein|nr:hypothetical protein [Thermodesulfobacteriota bacterium]MEE4354278.1 hypothetical protein [Desulfatiglans sp.]